VDAALDPEIDPRAYARRWRTLGVLCLSLMIVMVGNVSLNLALPAMARDLDASTSALQWIVDAYALVFAGLLFTAGTVGDRFGRKGALQGGLVLFLVGAVAAVVGRDRGGRRGRRGRRRSGSVGVVGSAWRHRLGLRGRPPAGAGWARGSPDAGDDADHGRVGQGRAEGQAEGAGPDASDWRAGVRSGCSSQPPST
jgi:hypothetical protein